MTAGLRKGPWPFWVLFGVQTLGASILFWYGVPLYRQVFTEPAVFQADLRRLLWALPSITLMQLGYWISFRVRPPLPELVQPVLGHVVLCVAEFGFVFVTSVFSLVFLMPEPGLSIPVGRYVVTILGMFSVFCYTLELARFGRRLLGAPPRD
jgi:hypothetical protein